MIEVRGLSIRLGEFSLRQIDLRIESGSYGVVLGPTGAGKTVLLECIVGLHQPDSGRVLLDGADVTHTPPERRRVAYVPQDYCLFPHLTVFENIAFGLRLRRQPAPLVAERVEQLAALLRIETLLGRRPLNLSGGEKQRIALARALAIEPRVLLLDEPLAAVDERTRERLTGELKSIQRELSATIIHVCHNFEEALALADTLAVFCDGEIRQAGPPDDVFHRPNSEFVARFMGCSNLLRGSVLAAEGGVFVADELRLELPGAPPGEATLVIRPEEIVVGGPGEFPEPATVLETTPAQRYVRLRLRAAGHELEAVCRPADARRLQLAPGSTVSVALPPERCHLLSG